LTWDVYPRSWDIDGWARPFERFESKVGLDILLIVELLVVVALAMLVAKAVAAVLIDQRWISTVELAQLKAGGSLGWIYNGYLALVVFGLASSIIVGALEIARGGTLTLSSILIGEPYLVALVLVWLGMRAAKAGQPVIPLLSLQARGDGAAIRLSWEMSADLVGLTERGFRLVRSRSGFVSNPDDGESVVEGRMTTAIDRRLQPGVTYWYTLFQLGRPFVATATARTEPPLPEVLWLQVRESIGAISLHWRNPPISDQGEVVIQRAKQSNDSWAIVQRTIGESFTDENVVAGENYQYLVRNGDRLGRTSLGIIVEARGPELEDVDQLSCEILPDGVHIRWKSPISDELDAVIVTATSGGENFEIYRGLDPGFVDERAVQSGEHTRSYQIQADYRDGNLTEGKHVSAVGLRTVDIGENLRTEVSGRSVVLKWEHSAEAIEARITRSGPFLTSQTVDVPMSGLNEAIDSSAEPGNAYTYQLVWEDNAGYRSDEIRQTQSVRRFDGGHLEAIIWDGLEPEISWSFDGPRKPDLVWIDLLVEGGKVLVYEGDNIDSPVLDPLIDAYLRRDGEARLEVTIGYEGEGWSDPGELTIPDCGPVSPPFGLDLTWDRERRAIDAVVQTEEREGFVPHAVWTLSNAERESSGTDEFHSEGTSFELLFGEGELPKQVLCTVCLQDEHKCRSRSVSRTLYQNEEGDFVTESQLIFRAGLLYVNRLRVRKDGLARVYGRMGEEEETVSFLFDPSGDMDIEKGKTYDVEVRTSEDVATIVKVAPVEGA